MSRRLHIPFQDLADYYEAGWMLYGPSDTPGFVTVAWKRTRAAVVPFACVADVMIRRDIERLQIREAALERLRPSRLIQADQIGQSLPWTPKAPARIVRTACGNFEQRGSGSARIRRVLEMKRKRPR
jgi:hypothetical protein